MAQEYFWQYIYHLVGHSLHTGWRRSLECFSQRYAQDLFACYDFLWHCWTSQLAAVIPLTDGSIISSTVLSCVPLLLQKELDASQAYVILQEELTPSMQRRTGRWASLFGFCVHLQRRCSNAKHAMISQKSAAQCQNLLLFIDWKPMQMSCLKF